MPFYYYYYRFRSYSLLDNNDNNCNIDSLWWWYQYNIISEKPEERVKDNKKIAEVNIEQPQPEPLDVGYEAVGYTTSSAGDGNSIKGHDHSKGSNPAYEPANPLQITNWMCQAARKYSTISIPGIYGSVYNKFPLGQLFQRELQIRIGQCSLKKYNERLLHLIEVGRIDATKVISHTMNSMKHLKGMKCLITRKM
jgi:threonine dehydrogenase-like Zn-dependent dehydrogenase